jgi:hypothetical protein
MHCIQPIWEHLEASVWLFRVSELFSDNFQTILHFVNEFSKSYLLWYTREQLLSEEKNIFQLQTTSVNKKFIYHPQIIAHAPMYHLDLSRWAYSSPSWLSSIRPRHIVQHCNTFSHFLIIINYTATISIHSHTFSISPNISVIQWHHILCHFPHSHWFVLLFLLLTSCPVTIFCKPHTWCSW